ncbi:uncharacterized protein PHALS_11263 [Plasmopara halstedii]|uniref:Uncharacterized protein n=1 Tax=Plasmopara halstedii TaxID=4781 RepID=A0A0P1AIU3_PLAHL|nr:uncharacterized protein PHALS_11263 [Plasmopara halstedii]CEG41096.1 hypothetical protein PHALS_11263 [Plasmopara halstedii]|eukprot:XP_024577465.1 hypothetical protein PHALS_11263 [Plasmopara halstedii]
MLPKCCLDEARTCVITHFNIALNTTETSPTRPYPLDFRRCRYSGDFLSAWPFGRHWARH